MQVDNTERLMTWTLDRPEQSNGIDDPTMADMDSALSTLEDNGKDISCLLIRGDEAVFSTGIDAEILKDCFEDRTKFTDIIQKIAILLDKIAALPQITIACVDGDCRLGGLEPGRFTFCQKRSNGVGL